jgi:hypothetical protein
MRKVFRVPSICPICGSDVPKQSRACPECGADERTGWDTARTSSDGLGLLDDDFDYDVFLQKTFGRPKSSTPRKWWLVALLLIILLLAPLLLAFLRA